MNDEERGSSNGNPLLAIVLALLVAGGGGTYYFYGQYQKSQRELTQMRAASAEGIQAEVAALVEEVGELIELPGEETPTMATIRNPENLTDHPFLSKGQEGDRLLIYTEDKLVVMYRPETGKIVAVGSVVIEQAAGETAGAETSEEPTEEEEGGE